MTVNFALIEKKLKEQITVAQCTMKKYDPKSRDKLKKCCRKI